MKIISYNVNGIRAALKKGLYQWVKDENPDIFCIQEAKAHSDSVDLFMFRDMGYEVHWHQAEKKGYSGVAIFSKPKARHVEIGSGIKDYDKEGRIIRCDYDDFSLLNVYIPSGSSGDVRQDYKMIWLEDFYSYIKELLVTHPNLVLCGDMNIAHHPIDIHNPVSNKKSSGFLPEERDWLTRFLDLGFVDTFRHFYPETPDKYSWWTFRVNARANNKGWRIDYFIASEGVKDRLTDAGIHNEAVHSDHCPIRLELS